MQLPPAKQGGGGLLARKPAASAGGPPPEEVALLVSFATHALWTYQDWGPADDDHYYMAMYGNP